jgi:hypothetical protein
MKAYKEFLPTQYDSHIPLENREDWWVLPCARNRDSDSLEESNFAVAVERLQKAPLSQAAEQVGEADYEIHRFGHWGPGWFEIVLVRPHSPAACFAFGLEKKLQAYPILDENHYSDLQYLEAGKVWGNCYSPSQRVEYLRKHPDQFEFASFADLLGCVRGKWFAGNPSDLL